MSDAPQPPGWGQPTPPSAADRYPPPQPQQPGCAAPQPSRPDQSGWAAPPQAPGWAAPPQPGPPQPQPPGWGPPPPGGQPGWQQPQPQWAPTGAGYPPPPSAAKKRKWPWILGIVLAFLVLTIGGCAALIAFGFRAVTAPVDAANAWLDAVADGRQTEVDRISCDIGVADGTVATLDDVGFNGRQNLNESQIISDVATVSGTIETDAGTLPISFQLFKAGDGEGEKGWCVSSAFVG